MSSKLSSPDDDLQKRLTEELQEYLGVQMDEIIEEEAKKAAERVKERMREKQDQAILSILDHYSVERMGPHLKITVKHLYEKE